MVDASDPHERGRQRGRQSAAALTRTWPIYRALFDATARENGRDAFDPVAVATPIADAVSAWSTRMLRELEGVADGADVPLSTIVALNARTEVLAAADTTATECSTVVRLGDRPEATVSAQTWDWHADLRDGWHVHTVRGDRHSFTGLTEHGMLAKIGVNSAGLGLHFNLLRHAADGSKTPSRAPGAAVPVHLVVRAILGEAATVADAVDIASSAPLAASSVLTVVTGVDAAAIELSPAGVAVLPAYDGWLAHANHFLDPKLAAGEAVTRRFTTTFERQKVLERRAAGVDATTPADLIEVLGAHEEDGGATCRHVDPTAPFGYRTATLATVVLRPTAARAVVVAGGPCEGGTGVELSAA